MPETLRDALVVSGGRGVCSLSDATATIPLDAITGGSSLGGRSADFAGRSVLIATRGQLASALAMIELDGLARRIVLCPPDLSSEQLPSIIKDAGADALVCSEPREFEDLGVPLVAIVAEHPVPALPPVAPRLKTEWLMLTSGTTGRPKIAIHTLAGLTGAIPNGPAANPPVWATFYDIRRYGGLQILLRALLSGGSLVLSHPGESIADHLARLAAAGVTHISGTPTHWRRALMSSAAAGFAPLYVRLSGEIADQAILDALKSAYPQASTGHAYASTEAGVGFEVTDGREGFPESCLNREGAVEMKIEAGSLRIRSNRMALGYAGRPDLQIAGADGFADTGDMVEIRSGRCTFTGRRGGIINVGGLKVHPEEVETVINRHAAVRLSRVRPRRSPIIGAIVVADVVLKDETGSPSREAITSGILSLCGENLAAHKIPAIINFVASIETTAGGKVARANA